MSIAAFVAPPYRAAELTPFHYNPCCTSPFSLSSRFGGFNLKGNCPHMALPFTLALPNLDDKLKETLTERSYSVPFAVADGQDSTFNNHYTALSPGHPLPRTVLNSGSRRDKLKYRTTIIASVPLASNNLCDR